MFCKYIYICPARHALFSCILKYGVFVRGFLMIIHFHTYFKVTLVLVRCLLIGGIILYRKKRMLQIPAFFKYTISHGMTWISSRSIAYIHISLTWYISSVIQWLVSPPITRETRVRFPAEESGSDICFFLFLFSIRKYF